MPLTLPQRDGVAHYAAFKRYGVPPASVIIEITEEQAFSPHSEISMHTSTSCVSLPAKNAIDDFGTGYANYERLKRLAGRHH